MSTEHDDNASIFTSQSDIDSDNRQSAGPNGNAPRQPRKKSRSSAKPRLTAHQKNTNHKDAENKRRNAIRERFTELSTMVPGTAGQERSEQVMLQKTSEFLRCQMAELRQLERLAHERGIDVDKDAEALKDSDYGGRLWREVHMEEYREQRERKKRKVPTLFASASKILKPGAARGQNIAHNTSSTPLHSFRKIETPPSYIPVKRAAYVSPAPSTSPPDKPLPSLPVATVVGKSPIQSRSLIDAAERPLRRSVSLPPPGQVAAELEEEWPALSPYRPALNQYDARLARPPKASVGESVLEAMRGLHIGNHGNKTSSSLQPDKGKGPPAIKNSPSQSAVSALPPPPSFGKAKTLDRRRLPPRAGSSGGGDKPGAGNDNITSSLPHSRSTLHHTATGRGSPYTLITNSSNESLHQHLTLSRESLTPLHAAQSVAGKEAKPIVTSRNKRKTSIPIPSRLIHRLPSDESELDVPRVKFRRGSHQYRELSPSDADLDTDHKSAKSESPASVVAAHNKPTNALTVNGMTFTELMATPAPTRRQVRRPAPEPEHPRSGEDQGSELGYDSDGGFEVKKMRAPTQRPDPASSTLRITDSARKVLGEKSEQANRQVSPVSHFTKPSDVIKSTMQLTRTLTNRSVVRLSSAPTLAGSVKGEDVIDDGDDGDYGDDGDETAIKHGQSQESLVQSKYPVLAAQIKTSQIPEHQHHHDWPLKDFTSFAAITKDRVKRPSSSRASSDSSWIPPVDWGSKDGPSDRELPSCALPVFTNDATTVPPLRNHFSSPTPPLSVRRPRETVPVKKIEAKPENKMANTLRFFAPTGPAFAASAATTPTPYAAAPTTATTTAAAASASTTASKATPKTGTMVSALRSLFHKKSSELGRGHGSVRSSSNKRMHIGRPQPYRPSTPLRNGQHSYNHGLSFGAASSTPTLNHNARGGRVIETDGGSHLANSTSAAAPHLIARAVAAARDAQDALAQARLAVAQCEQCVDRTNAVVAQ
ncbi:hypothetical protein DV738_g536, partial [Chaetothyriales sp. CBS 135597]